MAVEMEWCNWKPHSRVVHFCVIQTKPSQAKREEEKDLRPLYRLNHTTTYMS